MEPVTQQEILDELRQIKHLLWVVLLDQNNILQVPDDTAHIDLHLRAQLVEVIGRSIDQSLGRNSEAPLAVGLDVQALIDDLRSSCRADADRFKAEVEAIVTDQLTQVFASRSCTDRSAR